MTKNRSENKPDTSFIIISHNQFDLLRASINSIRSQVLNNSYEIIVIDTGSRKKIKTWLINQKDILSLFSCHRNRSLSEHLSLGITAAQGKFTCLFGNGSLIFPDTLRIAAEVIDNCSNDEIFGGVVFSTKQIRTKKDFGVTKLNKYNAPLISSGLILTKVLKRLGDVGDSIGFLDIEITLKLLKAGYELRFAENAYAEVSPYPLIYSPPKFASFGVTLKKLKTLAKPDNDEEIAQWHRSDQPKNLIEKPQMHFNLYRTLYLPYRLLIMKVRSFLLFGK